LGPASGIAGRAATPGQRQRPLDCGDGCRTSAAIVTQDADFDELAEVGGLQVIRV
jgi:hypothetical protein